MPARKFSIRTSAPSTSFRYSCLALGGFEIHAQAALVAVVHREVTGTGARQPPRVVAAGGFDLDHVGAHVRQDQPCRRAHDHMRELDYLDAGERPCVIFRHRVSRFVKIIQPLAPAVPTLPGTALCLKAHRHRIARGSCAAAGSQPGHNMNDIDVLISEVGPRDGLQSIKSIMPIEAKKAWIQAEAAAGVREIEVGSFVPPKLLPQLADTAEVVAFARTIPGLTVAALVPNFKGAENAVKAGAHKITLPLSVSETHSQANLKKTHAQVLEEVRKIVELLNTLPADERPAFEGGLSTAFGCTLEGAVSEAKVVDLARQLIELGCDEVGLSDTTGYANPTQIRRLIKLIWAEVGRGQADGCAPAQHARPRARECRGCAGRRHYHVGQLPRRPRWLPFRTRRQRQHRHRRPGLHARCDGPAHRHRSRQAFDGARDRDCGPAG